MKKQTAPDGKSQTMVNTFNPKVENISVGDTVNYKQLTDYLEIKYANGKEKLVQLERLTCFLDYEKQKTKFLINGIYDKDTATANYQGYINH